MPSSAIIVPHFSHLPPDRHRTPQSMKYLRGENFLFATKFGKLLQFNCLSGRVKPSNESAGIFPYSWWTKLNDVAQRCYSCRSQKTLPNSKDILFIIFVTLGKKLWSLELLITGTMGWNNSTHNLNSLKSWSANWPATLFYISWFIYKALCFRKITICTRQTLKMWSHEYILERWSCNHSYQLAIMSSMSFLFDLHSNRLYKVKEQYVITCGF